MADTSSMEQELKRAKEQINSQKKRILSTTGDIDSFILELKKVQEIFWTASKMSNVGARQFNDKMEDVISNLQKASQLIEDIDLR